MGKIILEDSTMQNIADAIRGKNGESDSYLPSEMPQKIKDIETGGSSGGGDFVINNNFTYLCSTDVSKLEQAAAKGDYIVGDSMFYNVSLYRFNEYVIDIPIKFLSMNRTFEKSTGNPNSLKKTAWDTSKCIDMMYCFNSTHLGSVNLLGWDTSNVVDFSGFFRDSRVETAEGINDLKTNSAVNLSYMFYNSYFKQDLCPNWNVNKVRNIDYMFYGCRLVNVDLSKLNFKSLVGTSNSLNFNKTYIKNIILPNLPVMSGSGNITIIDSTNSRNNDIHVKFGEGNTWGNEVDGDTFSLSLAYLWRTADFVPNFIEFAESIANNTSGHTRNILVYNALYDVLTEDQIAILTEKGYTVVRT